MVFRVKYSQEFIDWFDEQEKPLQRIVLMYLGLLEEYGPQLSRPHADTLKGSKLKNLKELRMQYKSNPYRILYAFDPERQAIVLIAGNKASDKKWYDKMIVKAEAIFAAQLKDLKREADENGKESN